MTSCASRISYCLSFVLAFACGVSLAEAPQPSVMPLVGSPDKVALGGLLFEDPTLSNDGKTSCGTCHSAVGTRSVRLAPKATWSATARSFTLAGAMKTDLRDASLRARAQARYVSAFAAAYGSLPEAQYLIDALVVYQQSVGVATARGTLSSR